MCCPVTLQPLIDPLMHTPCGNMFSREVFENVSRCPLCKAALKSSDIGKVPNFVRNKVNELAVRCSRCTKEMPREEFERHAQKYCAFPCPRECGEETTHERLNTHLEYDCMRKRVECSGADKGCHHLNSIMSCADDITKEEAKLTKELTKKLAKAGCEIDFENHEFFDLYTLPRFLRARDHYIDKAYDMFVNHLKWRKENDVDTIIERCPHENPCFELLQAYWPGQYLGEDTDGVPVWLERGGQVDVQALMKHVSLKELLDYHTYTQEVTMKMKKHLTAKLGKNCYSGVVIEDMKGYFAKGRANSAAIAFVKGISAMYADNYPETLKRFYCINAPVYLSIAYKLVKKFIDPVAAKKIQIVGSSYLDTLHEVIDDDNISVDYGGNLDIHLSGGGTFTGMSSKGCTYKPFQDDVSAGITRALDVTVDANDVGSKLEYEFTSNKDIKFGVSFKNEAGDLSDLLPLKSVDAHKSAKTGSFEVEGAGVFTLTFDNSDSWVRSKTVTYHVRLTGGAKKKKSSRKGEEDKTKIG